MMDDLGTSRTPPDDFVEFWSSGQAVKGEFHCAGCCYGVTVVRALPVFPMCGGNSWEQAPWSPFHKTSLL